jgi:urease
MGDANASIPSVQPFYAKPMWGSKAASAAHNSISFVSQISITSERVASYGLQKRVEAVKGCRKIGKKDMKWNDLTPKMTVDPESYEVKADGVLMDVQPAEKLPLGRLYNLF